jgi:hypothetical protein
LKKEAKNFCKLAPGCTTHGAIIKSLFASFSSEEEESFFLLLSGAQT